MRMAYAPYRLRFIEPGGTSRGVLTEKLTCLIKIYDEADPTHFGIGEAALFEGLSKEAGAGYEIKLLETLANVALGRSTDLTDYPSIQYGLEQAILDYSGGGRGIYFPSSFTEGQQSISINGLVWMGSYEEMLSRLERKLDEGFRCVKLKIGAIDFASELELLSKVRRRFSADTLELRVDANGAFDIDHVFSALKALETYGIHSIEQPIAAGQWDFMRMVCDVSPIPVALDEELIGLNTPEQRSSMLDAVKPRYIVLKPALCGGFSGAQQWIDLAVEKGIGWWVTSALESNVGLSALAQWTARLGNPMPQGLGTGRLFSNNFNTPVFSQGSEVRFNSQALPVDHAQFANLDWRE